MRVDSNSHYLIKIKLNFFIDSAGMLLNRIMINVA